MSYRSRRRRRHDEDYPIRPSDEGTGALVMVAMIFLFCVAVFFLVTGKSESPVHHTPPAPDQNSVPITIPEPEGCVKCEGPTGQPEPVVPPEPVPYQPHPNPYLPPPHNPLVPHPEWGQPKQ